MTDTEASLLATTAAFVLIAILAAAPDVRIVFAIGAAVSGTLFILALIAKMGVQDDDDSVT